VSRRCEEAKRGDGGAETGRHHGDGVRRAIRDPSDGDLLDLHRFHIQRVLLGSVGHIRGDGVPVSGPGVLDRSMPVSSPFASEFCGVVVAPLCAMRSSGCSRADMGTLFGGILPR
jgi:hypothetical protein